MALGVLGVLVALGVGGRGGGGGRAVAGGLEVLRVHYAASCAPCPRR